jgi:hypothetical protein
VLAPLPAFGLKPERRLKLGLKSYICWREISPSQSTPIGVPAARLGASLGVASGVALAEAELEGLDALGVALAVGCAVSLHPASPTSPSVAIAATIVSRTAMPRAVDAIRFPLFIAVNSHPPRRTRPPGRARPAR